MCHIRALLLPRSLPLSLLLLSPYIPSCPSGHLSNIFFPVFFSLLPPHSERCKRFGPRLQLLTFVFVWLSAVCIFLLIFLSSPLLSPPLLPSPLLSSPLLSSPLLSSPVSLQFPCISWRCFCIDGRQIVHSYITTDALHGGDAAALLLLPSRPDLPALSSLVTHGCESEWQQLLYLLIQMLRIPGNTERRTDRKSEDWLSKIQTFIHLGSCEFSWTDSLSLKG